MKAVDLIVRRHLPPELRDRVTGYDSKGIGELLATVAHEFPDKYEAISKALVDIGRNASYRQGESITLQDMFPVVDRDSALSSMDAELAVARKTLPPAKYKQERTKIWLKYSDALEKATFKAGMSAGNNVALSVVSGARGKAPQLKAMLTTPGLYEDHRNEVVPFFVRHSYAEGLSPTEYMSSTFGARRSVVNSKKSVAQGGDWGKLLVQASARQVVTEPDCGTTNGIDLGPEDETLRRRVLAHPVAGMKAGTIVDKHAVKLIRKAAPDAVIVRSPLTCQAREGVCAKCAGALSTYKLPSVGDAVGITAGQTVAEPPAQGALNMKHVSGQAAGRREYSGFDWISQFTQAPEEFKDRATVSEKDGQVDLVEPAPQGGQFVTVAGHKHYVAPGFEVLVKPGQNVEAGDQIGDGLVDVADIIRLKGLGEGRRYYASRLNKLLKDSGFAGDPKNTEMLARAAIDHVTIDDNDNPQGHLPDDIVSYNSMASRYTPPEDTETDEPGKAIGKFLQAPTLHYSIGTKITPKIAEHLTRTGFKRVDFSPTEPSFRPEMVRLRVAAPEKDDDWLSAQATSYLRKQYTDHAVRGSDTDIAQNTHWAPRLAVGVGFGDNVRQTGKF